MRIGIIGAGHIGGNLAQLLVRRGHQVSIANSRGPQTLTAVAERTGAIPVETADAPRDADVVIVSVPLKAVAELPDGLLDNAAPGAVVIDTNNYYPQRDGQITPIDAGAASSQWVSAQLGHPVVKVFNTIAAQDLLDRAGGERALPVAGDDERAKAVVLQLVGDIGFDAVDTGGLDASWRFEPGTPAYGPDVNAAELNELLGRAQRP